MVKNILAIDLLPGEPASKLATHADMPGLHPGYLHALTDLRMARWLMERRPGDRRVYENEDVALTEVDAAIRDIMHAAIVDDTDLRDHPMSVVPKHDSRPQRAIEYLKQARNNVAREEDNPETREPQGRAYGHVDTALRAAQQAHPARLRDMDR